MAEHWNVSQFITMNKNNEHMGVRANKKQMMLCMFSLFGAMTTVMDVPTVVKWIIDGMH